MAHNGRETHSEQMLLLGTVWKRTKGTLLRRSHWRKVQPTFTALPLVKSHSNPTLIPVMKNIFTAQHLLALTSFSSSCPRIIHHLFDHRFYETSNPTNSSPGSFTAPNLLLGSLLEQRTETLHRCLPYPEAVLPPFQLLHPPPYLLPFLSNRSQRWIPAHSTPETVSATVKLHTQGADTRCERSTRLHTLLKRTTDGENKRIIYHVDPGASTSPIFNQY